MPTLFYLCWKGLNQTVTCTIGASLPPDPQPVRLLEVPIDSFGKLSTKNGCDCSHFLEKRRILEVVKRFTVHF